FHHCHAAVGGTEVNANDFSHNVFLLFCFLLFVSSCRHFRQHGKHIYNCANAQGLTLCQFIVSNNILNFAPT
ncbi:MAG: hypothetical protein IJS91_01045, partial [Bacteroidales bacterium]|nr:hypothetical protein [Bacteroidales bacterium]